MPSPTTLVLLAHPDLPHSRVTRRVAEALATEPGVRVHDLYARYPDFWIDVDAERAALRDAALVVWLHPIHWYAMPALMKLWVDRVLGLGWAYGPGGDALAGKTLWLVASAGSAAATYTAMGGSAEQPLAPFLPPYEQTAALARMRWLPPSVLFHAHRVSDAEVQGHVDRVMARWRQHGDAWEGATWPLSAPVEGDRTHGGALA
jgi:glutathione-regulated potassium-efflux system ancillary protein KefF